MSGGISRPGAGILHPRVGGIFRPGASQLGAGALGGAQVPAWAKVAGFSPSIAMDFTRGLYYGASFSDISTTRSTNNSTIDSAGNTVNFSNNQVRISDLGIRYTTDDTMVISGALARAIQSSVGTLLVETGISELVEGVFDITTGGNFTDIIGGAGSVDIIGRGGNGAVVNNSNGTANINAASTSPGNGRNFDSDCQAIAISSDASGNRALSLGGGTPATGTGGFGSATTVYIGRRGSGAAGSGLIRAIRYFPQALTGANLQAISFYIQSLRKFAAWGDSLVAGSGASDAAHRWIDLLATGFNPDAYYYNGGNGGDTSSQVLTRFNADSIASVHRGWINIFWCGHNTPDAVQTLADIGSMVGQITGERKYLVCSPLQNTANAVGSAGYNAILATRTALSAAYGARYVDIFAALAAAAPGDPNVANGYTPSTLLADTIHLNDSGQDVARAAVLSTLNSLGW